MELFLTSKSFCLTPKKGLANHGAFKTNKPITDLRKDRESMRHSSSHDKENHSFLSMFIG